MADTPDTYQSQSQPDGTAFPAGEPKIDPQAPGASEDRSFASRPSDTEAAHHNEGGHSWRSQSHGDIGGDLGRDESKGPSQGETGATASGASQSAMPQGLPPNSEGGRMEHQDPAHADDLRNAVDQRTGGAGGGDLGGDYDQTYNPDEVEANRLREQGGGFGAKDLRAQGDPTRGDTTDQFGD